MKIKNVLNLLPDHPIFNNLIVYVTSIYFHKSLFFYFSKTLNGYILRNKASSDFLSQYVDKIKAKEFIKEKVGDNHVIKILKKYDGSMPEASEWVFKSNNDFSGGLLYFDNNVIDVKKIIYEQPVKVKSNIELPKHIQNFIVGNNQAAPFRITREGCYKNLKKQYFFEEFVPLVNEDGQPANEYKFHCLNGRVEFLYLVYDRSGVNKRVIFNRDRQILPFSWCKPRDIGKFEVNGELIKLSKNFDLMLKLAEVLSSSFKYVRVDIYDTHPHPKIGELTFFHGSGLEPIIPKVFDYEYGSKL